MLETGQGGSTTFGGTSHRVGPPSPVIPTVPLLELSELSQTGLGGTGMGAQIRLPDHQGRYLYHLHIFGTWCGDGGIGGIGGGFGLEAHSAFQVLGPTIPSTERLFAC